jgi:hypothetical protein
MNSPTTRPKEKWLIGVAFGLATLIAISSFTCAVKRDRAIYASLPDDPNQLIDALDNWTVTSSRNPIRRQ